MTPKEQYLDNLGKSLITNMEKRQFEAYYCATKEDALNQACSLLTKGSSISWGGSQTLLEIGLFDALTKEEYTLFNRDLAKTPEEKSACFAQAVTSDFYFMSSNAITQKGELVNIDGAGNRVACLCHGPKSVIIIASLNKVVPDVDAALARIRNTATPQNALRLNCSTPCSKTSTCADCLVPDCLCAQLVITRFSRIPKRIKVILVGESLGY